MYVCVCACVCVQYTQEYSRLLRLSQSWQALKQKVNVGLELAEKTLAYWQTCPTKLLVRTSLQSVDSPVSLTLFSVTCNSDIICCSF